MRHLRPSQVAWRFVNVGRLQINRFRPPAVDWIARGATFALHASSPVPFRLEPRHSAVAHLWARGEVEHLAVHRPREDWAGTGLPKLWRYERQYHSELVALALAAAAEGSGAWLERARDLVKSWTASCPQPRGDAWEPYPVAR